MTKKKPSKFDLHEVLRRRSYDHALISTYTFSPNFFEDYCLEKFNSLKSNGNISILVDSGTYAEVITGSSESLPQKANLRYLLHPVRVPGRFHSKVFLFAEKNRGLLVIGSANFSRQGITSNAELIACYEYENEKKEQYKYLFQSAFRYFLQLSAHSPGQALDSNIQAITRDISWLSEEEKSEMTDSGPELLDNSERPLWVQLKDRVEPPVDCIWILSRFFDPTPSLLERISKELQPRKIRIFTQNGITTLKKQWLDHQIFKDGLGDILLCTYRDEEHVQPLHAKAIAIQKGEQMFFLFGSSNFTTPGMMTTIDEGNAEVLICFHNLNRRSFKPEKLFDPESSAVKLITKDQLISAPGKGKYSTPESHDIFIEEAWVDNDDLRIIADISESLNHEALHVNISLPSQIDQTSELKRTHERNYATHLSSQLIRDFENFPAVIQVLAFRDGASVASSNRLLVINLQDFKTGENVRKSRQIREAQQSAYQFIGVLNGLVESGDEEALKQFLIYCDIPVTEILRPLLPRGGRPAWGGGKGMRNLGTRNLRHFINLHEAVLNFVDRHFKKLHSHVKSGTLEGVPNFMHIFLAICGLLKNQIERAIIGFEAQSSPLTITEWFDYRDKLEAYLNRFRQLMDCLWSEYVRKTLKKYPLEEIQKRFEPDLQELKEICSQIIQCRDRIEAVRTDHLKVKRPDGVLKVPLYFYSVLNDENWPPYKEQIENMLQEVEREVGRGQAA